MSEIILRADTPAQLKARLAELDIDVPLRSEGRRNHHAERYCIAHLLATLPVEQLSFPLNLTHSDKPDFLLAMPDTDVGIEHTEAVPENIARADFLREKEGLGPDVYFTPHVLPGEHRKTADELRREIEADEAGSGWCGDSPEREWAAAMADHVKEKMPKATADGFVRYPSNWLIVYDNRPLPAIDYSKAATYLAPLLAEMGAFSVFDTIFVHDDSHMCELGGTPIIHALAKPGCF
ncbi:hypothetical protein [Pigmentiphaga litoralis]|uniref:Uncharacterized protein n=1 Tax=Pigmentiphaga litoralis TaxID=516702 RepID=A0A7Y9IWD0_9BURK|nr:hypothetical protein [Pigmentiphaga litoralis]NYE22089.1 hypothetical protein [Pigmentiphaga litoralis]NYE84296.1 hypothetical protein [Pigmentiphaga litoralis]